MRKFILALALVVTSFGMLSVGSSEADARPWGRYYRPYTTYYGGYSTYPYRSYRAYRPYTYQYGYAPYGTSFYYGSSYPYYGGYYTYPTYTTPGYYYW